MKKICYFIILLSLAFTHALGNRNVRVFYNDWNFQYICISVDTLTFYNQVFDKLTEVYPVGVCSCVFVSDSIAELNSIRAPYPSIWDNVEVTTKKRTDEDSANVTKLIVSTPNCESPLQAHISYKSNIRFREYADVTITNGKLSLDLPLIINELTIAIYPVNYTFSNLYMLYFGLLDYCFTIGGNFADCSQINVTLNEVSQFQLDQYFLRGDYVRFVEGGLLWKGFFYKEEPCEIFDSTIKPNIIYKIYGYREAFK